MTANAAPALPPTLTLRALLRAAGLVFSGPLIVLGFVIDLGPETLVLVLGLDLLVWGTKSPPRFEQICWSGVPVVGSLSHPWMIAAGVVGFVLLAGSAWIAAPLPPPPAGDLAPSSSNVAVDRSAYAQAHLAGNILYAVFRDPACAQKLQDAGRAQFSDLPIPPSSTITLGSPGSYYWQATLVGNASPAAVRSDCTPIAVGIPHVASPSARTGSLVVEVRDVAPGGEVRVSAHFERADLSYALHRDATCTTPTGATSSHPVVDHTPSSATITFANAGIYYWQARLSVDGRVIATTTCARVTVPRNVTTLALAPINGAFIGAAPSVLSSTTLSGTTRSAGGTIAYTLYADSACTSRLDDRGTVIVRRGALTDSSVGLNAAGAYFMRATYGGDANNDPSASACVAVSVKPNQPTLTAGATQGVVGRAMWPAAALARATSNAGGEMMYSFYSDSACIAQVSSTRLPVTGGTADAPILERAGTFGVRVTYSGDGNNTHASSPCWRVSVRMASPRLVLLQPPAGSIGSAAKASASFDGAYNPIGTVRFTLANDSSCDGLPQVDGGNVSADTGRMYSSPMTFSNAGIVYWRASYGGDANHEPATSACLPQTIVANRPAVTASLSPTSVAVGGQGRLSAALSGATTNAGGEIAFRVYRDAGCTNPLVDAGSRLVSGARGGESDPIRFADARTVWWQASYSGDGNNFAAASTCIAQTIAKTRPTISVALTSNRLFVRARVAATLNGGSTNAGGNVTYAQYYDSRCSGGAFSTTALGTVRVTNGVVPQSPTTMLVSTSNYVVVTFTGDDNNEAANSGCVSLPAAR